MADSGVEVAAAGEVEEEIETSGEAEGMQINESEAAADEIAAAAGNHKRKHEDLEPSDDADGAPAKKQEVSTETPALADVEPRSGNEDVAEGASVEDSGNRLFFLCFLEFWLVLIGSMANLMVPFLCDVSHWYARGWADEVKADHTENADQKLEVSEVVEVKTDDQVEQQRAGTDGLGINSFFLFCVFLIVHDFMWLYVSFSWKGSMNLFGP